MTRLMLLLYKGPDVSAEVPLTLSAAGSQRFAVEQISERRLKNTIDALTRPRQAIKPLPILSSESVPDEEGNLFAVYLDAAAHGFGDKNALLSVDLDRHRAPELLFTV